MPRLHPYRVPSCTIAIVGTSVVFYDGVCGLCDRLVQFLLARDTHARLRFAPLQGTLARELLVPRDIDPSDLDSVFVVAEWRTPQEHVLARSRAVLHALRQLGGGWAVLARVGRLVPAPLADVVYRGIARVRYRLFGRYDTCPMPRPEWRDRML